VQRLESDAQAVQIMTVHKSKGLEADVVFLYGGLGRASTVRSASSTTGGGTGGARGISRFR